MLTLPIFTRLMSTNEYGVFSVYQSWYQILSIITTLNLAGAVLNNGFIKYEDRRNEFISSMQGLSTTITVSVFIIYLITHSFWEELLDLPSVFILIMFTQLLVEPAYLFWMQRKRFEFQYQKVVIITMLITCSSPAVGIIAVLASSNKAFARVLSYALVQICIGLIFYIFQFIKGRKFYIKEYWHFAMVFNIPLVPHYLSQVVLGQADRIMINKMVGEDKAGIYSVAYTIASALTFPINAINAAYIPTLYQNMKEKKYEIIYKSSTILCVIMGLAALSLMLFGPEIIWFVGSKEYREAIWLIPPVAGSVYFTYLYSLFINIELYYEKTQYTMVVSVIGAMLNIALNAILIQVFGYIAAGYTTLFCYILFAIGHGFLARYRLKKDMVLYVFNYQRLIALSTLIVITTILINLLYFNDWIRYVIILSSVIGVVGYRKKIYAEIKKALHGR